MGKFVHDCENEMFCESINTKIPYFNAPIYLENKVDTTEQIECDSETNNASRPPLAKSTRSSAH